MEFRKTTRFIQSVTLLVCTVLSTPALAEPSARVGRVSLSQGQVGISSAAGDPVSAAQVNWPVTAPNVLTTGRGARSEIRIGSTSIRLDADSSLEVSELDDERLRLRLNYGSVNVRILNAEALAGFELATPNARVRLQEPGRLRVDAGRGQGASVINVFDGVALVADRGTQLIVRVGRRAEIRDDDVLTGQAARDSFDDWSLQRDQLGERSTSARYVGSEMTGHEELDRNGAWRDDPEHGPLWQPTTVAAGWAPYRDGSWTWIAPWGWTWVDNAPWGYAPSHYGRWVQANGRWAWAPGRQVGRPVWAPALVGWVGGSSWRQNFGAGGHHPAQGWYPLTPRDAFVPGYRLSQQHLQHINRDARPGWREDGRGNDGRERNERPDHQRHGLTVVPHEQFGHRGTVAVRNAPRAVVPPLALQNAPVAAPTALTAPTAPTAPPGGARERDGRGGERGDGGDRFDRFDRDFNQRNRQHRPELSGAPAPRQPAPPANPAPAPVPGPIPAAVSAPAPASAPAPVAAPAPSPFTGRDGRPGFDDFRQRQQQAPPAQLAAPAAATQPGDNRPDSWLNRRDSRPDFEERRQRPAPPAAPTPQPAPTMAPPPVMQRQAPTPQPAPMMAPPPVMQRQAPTPAAQPAAAEPAPRAFRGDNKRGEERER